MKKQFQSAGTKRWFIIESDTSEITISETQLEDAEVVEPEAWQSTKLENSPLPLNIRIQLEDMGVDMMNQMIRKRNAEANK